MPREELYDNMVAGAAERCVEAGAVDLVDLAQAGERGFDVTVFQGDVEALADVMIYLK